MTAGDIVPVDEFDQTPLADRENAGGSFELTSIGLVVHGRPTLEQYIAEFSKMRQIQTAMQWYLGDLVNYGEPAYGEKYAQAIESGYDPDYLRNLSYIAQRFPMARRNAQCTWSQHALVASMPNEDADRWLALSAARGLTRAALKALIDPEGAPKPLISGEMSLLDLRDEVDRLISEGYIYQVKVSVRKRKLK